MPVSSGAGLFGSVRKLKMPLASLTQTYGPIFRKPFGFVGAITEPPLPDSMAIWLGTCAATMVPNIRTNIIDHTDLREFISCPQLLDWKSLNSTTRVRECSLEVVIRE